MPAPSTILDRPEFAILRRLSAEQLRRIGPFAALRSKPAHCPLAHATGKPAYLPGIGQRIDPINRKTAETEAEAFIRAWDGLVITRDELAAALAAALAAKEGADARP
jgi:hypothetical protein